MTSVHLSSRGCCSCRGDDCGQPSTSGRSIVNSRQRLRCFASMPPMYNTQPIPLRPSPADGVVKGARTTATPRLSPERVMQRLAELEDDKVTKHYGAFYSSELGGIVTQPGFMVIHIDDHMAHKGDAVYDAVHLVDGYLYQLDAHFERFKASAELAGLPFPMSEERALRALLDTAAASSKMNGMLHFWLSRGRGLQQCQTSGPTLYALLSTEVAYDDGIDRDEGWTAVTSPVDPKSPYFTALRSTSNIQGSIALLEAISRGADLGIFVDDEGTVLTGPECSIAIMTRDRVLVVPPDDTGLAGMAARTIAELALEYAKGADDLPIDEVQRRTFTVDELKSAAEAFAINNYFGVVGISHFDGEWIGDHEYEQQAGPVSLALNQLLYVDRQYKEGSSKHTEVPYGYMTGMKAQLR